MSRSNSKAVALVSARLMEPVQTAAERYEPGTVVQWPLAQVEALVASSSAVVLTADELGLIAAAAEAEAKAKAEADAADTAQAEADAAAAAPPGSQAPAGGSLL